MREPTNEDRAKWAEEAVEVHTPDGDQKQPYELVDLLCNLRHLADSRGLDWGILNASADRHYFDETEGEQ